MLLHLKAYDAKIEIKALQSCSTWTQILMKNSESGSRSTACTSALKKCPSTVNLKQNQKPIITNSLIIPGTESELNYNPLYYDIGSLYYKSIKKILPNYMKLDVLKSDQQ